MSSTVLGGVAAWKRWYKGDSKADGGVSSNGNAHGGDDGRDNQDDSKAGVVRT